MGFGHLKIGTTFAPKRIRLHNLSNQSLDAITMGHKIIGQHIENFGYYWAMNDYMDAATWIDWRSGSGGSNTSDPGWLKLNGRWDYNWLGRFLRGNLATNYWLMGDGTRNLGCADRLAS